MNKKPTTTAVENKVIKKEQDKMKGTDESLTRDPVETAQMLRANQSQK